ncbi:hypothetical protein [Sphingomonas sp. Leaf343]|uniref:hypothetical protein n=1 Tax=Sphingomonas sp. Leaf343 TaxID=1736345 RepID=UPI000701CE86|nr:hypothetical protein [Sphingomonas sp. Leaf343]KQR81228.1 hypothetical protein ASG07_12250 [Sphingomonas sp. Leaf343]
MTILNGSAGIMIGAEEAGCFRGTPDRVILGGPLKLYRLAGSRSGIAGPERGAWWFDGEMLAALADDVLEATYDGNAFTRRNILAGTRTDLAVKSSWSNMGWFCCLTLDAAQQLIGWRGEALAQKDHGAGFFEGLLPGGGTQFFIPGLVTALSVAITREPTHTALSRLSRTPNWRG